MTLCPPPVRFWIGVMIFFTTFTNYMLRSSVSISILDMAVSDKKGSVAYCLRINNATPEKGAGRKEAYPVAKLKWSKDDLSLFQSSYFWGYLSTCLFAGVIADYLGPFAVLFYSGLLSAILNSLTPTFCIYTGVEGGITVRILIGMLGGLTYPAINVLIARWAPPKEKGRFLAAMMGMTLGTVLAWIFVAQATVGINWWWGYHVCSIVMVVYCIFFFFLVSDSPQKHRWISEEEKQFILEAQEGTVSTKKSLPPLWQICKSIPFWALSIAQFGNLWGLNLILTYAPQFLNQYLGKNIKSAAWLAGMPYIARLFCSFGFGYAGDLMRKKEVFSVTVIRKFFIIFSHFLPSLFLFLVYPVGCRWEIVVVFLVLCQAFNGAVVVGHLQNPQDLSPNFAGNLYGYISFIGGVTGCFLPKIATALEDAYKDQGLLGPAIHIMIGGGVYAFCGIIFVLFASGEIQSWNKKKEDTPPEETPQAS